MKHNLGMDSACSGMRRIEQHNVALKLEVGCVA